MRQLSYCYVILTIFASMLLFPVTSSALTTDLLGQSSITTHSVLVGDTNEWLQKALPNCAGAGQSLQYDTTTKVFSCASGGGGDITAVWGCSTGDCSALTAAAGDTLDTGSADASSPATRSTTLPATCTEGRLHQDTDSGGSEIYVCTATNTWTKLLGSTDTADVLQTGFSCQDAGSTDAYACSLTPAITAYVTGTTYVFKANTANIGPATISLNALGALGLVKMTDGIGTALVDNDIRAGTWVSCRYDGTNCQMTSQLGNIAAGSLGGATLSTDGTFAANSDTLIPSEKAVKTYADTKQSALGYTPLNPSNNLSDVGSAATSRTNLSAQLDVGITAKSSAGTTVPGMTLTTLTHGDQPCYDGSGTPAWKNCEPGPATNAQTGTSYAIVGTSATSSGDKGKIITTSNASPVAVSIAAAGGAGFDALFSFKWCNIGAGAGTLTPTTSTINGAATLVLYKGDCADINSDGANYHALVAKDSIEVQAVVFDFTTDIATGDGKFYFLAGATGSKLVGKVLAAVQGQVVTAGTTGTTDVQLARCAQAATGNVCSGTVVDMLTTKLTIDSGENTSATAAIAAAINAANDDIAAGDVVRVDVDAISTTTAKGLLVTMIFRRP